jgi:hypothetical protein
VRVPPPEDGCGTGEVAEAFRGGVDERRDDAEVQVRDDECGDHQYDSERHGSYLPGGRPVVAPTWDSHVFPP